MRDLRLFSERLTRSTQQRLRGMLDRGREAIARPPAADATNVVEFTRLDLAPLNAQRSKWPRYDQLVRAGTAKVPQFDDLLTDLFFGLYLSEPSLRGRTRMAKTHHLNYDLYMQTQALPIWEDARTNAVYNPKHAIIGLVHVAQSLLDSLSDEQQQHQQDQQQKSDQQRDQQQQARDELAQMLEDLSSSFPDPPDDAEDGDEGEPGEDGSGSGQPQQDASGREQGGPSSMMAGMFGSMFDDDTDDANAEQAADAATPESGDATDDSEPDAEQERIAQDIEEQIERLLAQLDAAEDDGDDGPEFNENKVRRAAKAGMQQAAQELFDLNEWLSAWGSDPGEFNALSPDTAFGLYEKMRSIPNVKQFAMELGRMRATGLTAQMQRDAREPKEIIDITNGRSWTDALPTERLLLADPQYESIFWLRWAQEALLTWQYGGVEQASRGPFIMLIDVSGSTMGTPERWGKAFALTALDMARREERDCGIIFFDSHIRSDGIFTFPGGKASLTDKIAVASYFTGGGTDWQPPLSQALTNIEATDGTWTEADIVLITDGESHVNNEFAADYRQRCDARGIRTHGVLLSEHARHADSLKTVCDRAITVSTLAGAEAAKPIFDLLT